MSVLPWLLRARRSRLGVVRRLAVEGLALHRIDWPGSVEVGPGLRLPGRPRDIVVHPWVRIGAGVTVHPGVTLGEAVPWLRANADHRTRVVVEDGAVIGAGAVVVGSPGHPTVVGRGTVVAPGAVLTRSTGAGGTWAGNPARRVDPDAEAWPVARARRGARARR